MNVFCHGTVPKHVDNDAPCLAAPPRPGDVASEPNVLVLACAGFLFAHLTGGRPCCSLPHVPVSV